MSFAQLFPFFDPMADLVSIEAKQLAGLRPTVVRALERLRQQLNLEFFEVDALLGQLEERWTVWPYHTEIDRWLWVCF